MAQLGKKAVVLASVKFLLMRTQFSGTICQFYPNIPEGEIKLTCSGKLCQESRAGIERDLCPVRGLMCQCFVGTMPALASLFLGLIL